MSTTRRVAVAMSGGVDSSVAAGLLVERGEDVFGLMLRLWGDGTGGANRCCSPEDVAMARSVAGRLSIPFYVVDARTPFKHDVVDFFVRGYAQGITPNPCLECNRHIRWGFLLQHALALGATHLATGHYARIRSQNGSYELRRAADQDKDQSYVLSVMRQDHLAHALFPLGDYTKNEVRAHARRLGLPVAERHESQDLCFAGGDYRSFLARQRPKVLVEGPILDHRGRRVGVHHGLAGYTIGQRKGIGISAGEALYVLAKDPALNALVVGPRRMLGRSEFDVDRVNWISGAPSTAFRPSVRVRYKAREVVGEVCLVSQGAAHVALDEPLPDITPGQAAVFYQGDTCLGGGIIMP